MRIIPLCLVFLAISSLSNSVSAQDAQDYKVAIGVRFSSASPTLSNSVSIKYFLDESNAVEGLVSFGNRFGIGGLYERHQLIGATPAFKWFYGGGGYIGSARTRNRLANLGLCRSSTGFRPGSTEIPVPTFSLAVRASAWVIPIIGSTAGE